MNPHRRNGLLLLAGTVGVYAAAVAFALASLVVRDVAGCGCIRDAAAGGIASLGHWFGGSALLLLSGFGFAVTFRTVSAVRCAEALVRRARLGRRTLAGTRVQVVSGREPRAFCVGAFHPSIVVTVGFLGLPLPEQRAVLAHEHSHARVRDPLTFAVLDAVAGLLPLLRPVSGEFRRQAEFAADDAARRAVGDNAFAAALAKGIEAAPIGASFSPTEARVRRFLGHSYTAPRGPLVGSALTLAAVLLVLFTGVVGTRHAVARETLWCASQPVLCRGSASLRSHPRSDGVLVLCRSTTNGTVCVVR